MADRDPRFQEVKNQLANILRRLNRHDGSRDERPEQLVHLENAITEELAQWRVGVEIEILPGKVQRSVQSIEFVSELIAVARVATQYEEPIGRRNEVYVLVKEANGWRIRIHHTVD